VARVTSGLPNEEMQETRVARIITLAIERTAVMRSRSIRSALAMTCVAASAYASAATYQVGPARTHTSLTALFNAVNLEPGDVVEVDANGGTPYNVGSPGIVMGSGDAGAPGNPVILRGIRQNGQRPILAGGTNTIEFRSSNHVVFENFEVTGGSSRCVFHHAHDVTLRGVLVRDCPAQGVLGADQDSGSLTIEYSEVRNIGGRSRDHAVYMSTDQIAYPGSVFRLQYSYLHDSWFEANPLNTDGGNLIKSRAERNEIYYNWLADAFYHELELIGPDPDGVQSGWTDATAREDSDIVGNVIVHSADFGSMLRFGGDATSGGRGESFGRYRFVNNTVVRLGAGTTTPTVFRLFEGIESLEFHNNVFWRDGTASMTLVRAAEAQWTNGPRVTGSNNWIKSNFVYNPSDLPATLTGTRTGTTPGFSNAGVFDFRPAAGSPLLDTGGTVTVTPPNFDLASPLFPPTRHPSPAAELPIGALVVRPVAKAIDIGAYERPDLGIVFTDGFE
jgi:hypothetical protein